MDLTDKQSKFVKEYLVDLNATQAAIRAGYSKKTAQEIGSENLTKPIIQEEIQKEQQRHAEKTDITIEKVLNEYAKIGFSDLTEILNFEKGYMSLADFNKLTSSQRACFKKIEFKTEYKMVDGDPAPVYNVKFELYDKQHALDMIGKHLGMFVDKKEIDFKDTPKFIIEIPGDEE